MTNVLVAVGPWPCVFVSERRSLSNDVGSSAGLRLFPSFFSALGAPGG